jgi:hypothetical protein
LCAFPISPTSQNWRIKRTLIDGWCKSTFEIADYSLSYSFFGSQLHLFIALRLEQSVTKHTCGLCNCSMLFNLLSPF